MEGIERTRAGERGISPRAPAAPHVNEAPGPGAERKTQAAVTGGAGTPTGAVSSRGRAAFERPREEFEALVLATAQRLLAHERGSFATLRPRDVAHALGLEDAVLYSVIEDVLLRYSNLGEWQLAYREKKESNSYLRYVRSRVKCPLCGKFIRRSSVHEHAFSHFRKLEESGVLRLFKENGTWVVEIGGTKLVGVGWRALVLVAEHVSLKVRACPETRRAQAEWVTRARRAGVTYINLILGTPYGDPVELAKAIARHFGLKTLAVLIDDGDEPAVAYVCSKKVRERVFSALEDALESEGGLEEALARRFRGALVLSIFDGLDTVILVARER
jgi:hypothetical protein